MRCHSLRDRLDPDFDSIATAGVGDDNTATANGDDSTAQAGSGDDNTATANTDGCNTGSDAVGGNNLTAVC